MTEPLILLHSFTEWVSTGVIDLDKAPPVFCIDGLVESTYSRKSNNENLIRASNCGKPLVWHVANRYGILKPEALKPQTVRRFLRGHIEESETIALLKYYLNNYYSGHWELTDTQTELNLWGITGHCDFVLRTESGSVVCDVKTASSFSYSRWERRDYNDDYGYISQLAFYMEALGVDDACLLISSKDTQSYLLRVPPEEMRAEKKARLSRLVDYTNEIVESSSNFLEAYSRMYDSGQIPLPVEGMYRRKGTGKFKPHPTLAYDALAQLIYNTYEDDGKTYVASVSTPLDVDSKFNHWLNGN